MECGREQALTLKHHSPLRQNKYPAMHWQEGGRRKGWPWVFLIPFIWEEVKGTALSSVLGLQGDREEKLSCTSRCSGSLGKKELEKQKHREREMKWSEGGQQGRTQEVQQGALSE